MMILLILLFFEGGAMEYAVAKFDVMSENQHIISAPATIDEIEKQKESNRKTYFPSRFGFLRNHNGLRPGNLHGLIAPMSTGKSTLLQTIIADTCMNARVLAWLSEESKIDYQLKIMNTEISQQKIEENLLFAEEKMMDARHGESIETLMSYIDEQVIKSMCDVFFIDNITTSKIYNGNYGVNGYNNATKLLQNIARKNNIPIFYLAHTQKQVGKNYHRLLQNEDIRGVASIAIESEFMYCLNFFTGNNLTSVIAEITKNRGYKNPATFFKLVWSYGIYAQDMPVNFETVKKIFKTRNVL